MWFFWSVFWAAFLGSFVALFVSCAAFLGVLKLLTMVGLIEEVYADE